MGNNGKCWFTCDWHDWVLILTLVPSIVFINYILYVICVEFFFEVNLKVHTIDVWLVICWLLIFYLWMATADINNKSHCSQLIDAYCPCIFEIICYVLIHPWKGSRTIIMFPSFLDGVPLLWKSSCWCRWLLRLAWCSPM